MKRLNRWLLITLATTFWLAGGGTFATAQCSGQGSRANRSTGSSSLTQRLNSSRQNLLSQQQLTTGSTSLATALQSQQALATVQNDLVTAVSLGQLTSAQANQLAQDINLVANSTSNPSAAVLKLTADLQAVQQAGTLSPSIAQVLTGDINTALQGVLLSARYQQTVGILGRSR